MESLKVFTDDTYLIPKIQKFNTYIVFNTFIGYYKNGVVKLKDL
jgi:hypothetical protein